MLLAGLAGAVVTGISLGLVGGGGSILILPVLVYLLNVAPVEATSWSLLIVGTTSLIGVFTYARRRLINVPVAAVFTLPSLAGVALARTWLLPAIPASLEAGSLQISRGNLIMLLFAVIMILASASMIRHRPAAASPGQQARPGIRKMLIAAEGLLVGMVTGLVGAGGGFLIIPALVILARIPVKEAVGTSLVIITIKSLGGFALDLTAGFQPDLILLSAVGTAAIAGLFIGNAFSGRIRPEILRPAFGWFILLAGGGILMNQFFSGGAL